ncbi:hypothetical protein [Phaeovulum sp.]|nr:hypothetical protein [Phaeovulum sp.]MDP1670202.1 hypothetical protein [Phaeovulum sp.]MDP2062809.1 hypothetical protein [Phaeovulum sp.]MDP3860035.1 hypothetical protein [Phaeovulum sp.]MDZ4120302.1 hypothetical protein [Phaeovulum sp.]
MAQKVKAALGGDAGEIWQDAVGVAALVVMLMVGLHLPALL